MSTLQELWFGNVNPSEDKVITDEEQRLVELMAMHQEKLMSSLSTKPEISWNIFVMLSSTLFNRLLTISQERGVANAKSSLLASKFIR